MLTRAQVAEALSVHPRASSAFVAAGYFPEYKPAPNITRFDPRDVEAFIEASRSRWIATEGDDDGAAV